MLPPITQSKYVSRETTKKKTRNHPNLLFPIHQMSNAPSTEENHHHSAEEEEVPFDQAAAEDAHKKRVHEAQDLLKVIESMSVKQNAWRESFETICQTEAVQEAKSNELSRAVLLRSGIPRDGSFVTGCYRGAWRELRGDS